MPFKKNPQITGVTAEDNFVTAVDNKTFKELNPNMKLFLIWLFHEEIDEAETFHCFKTEDFIKPDVVINYKDMVKYVSIKTGASEQMHCEKLVSFIQLLRDHGISEESIETYLLYHYGDGSTNGSGETRLDGPTTYARYKQRLLSMNEEFNRNKAFVEEVVDRAIFQGVNYYSAKADAIFDGTVDYAVYISRTLVKKYVMRKDYSYLSYPHIGPLLLRPHARYANKEVKEPRRREEIMLTWPNLLGELQRIKKYFNLK